MDPGLDLHEWTTRWAQLDEVAHESPADAAPEMDRLVREMLEERGMLEADDEIQRRYRAGHELVMAYEGDDPDPGNLGEAIEAFREVFQTITAERDAP
jgi:hypothetical protein